MSRLRRPFALPVLLVVACVAVVAPLAAEAAEGQMTWAVHTSLVPTWFDPAESIQGTPFMVLSATHDALVKPMPGKGMAPCLAEPWTVSPDGLVYEFVLRKGVKFHDTNLKAAGIQLRLRPLERATLFRGVAENKYRNVVYMFAGIFGNAATWLEAYAVAGGTYVHGSYPDIDGLFREQAAELDRGRREATLHKMQKLLHERAAFGPIWDFAFLHGVGPRVEEAGLGLLGGYGSPAPTRT